MNGIITQDLKAPFQYEIDYNRNESRESQIKADHMKRLGPIVMGHVNELAELVAWSRPTVLPMTWTTLARKELLMWMPAPLGQAMPTITLPLNQITWGYSQMVRNRDNVPLEISSAYVVIPLVSSPSWPTYKRWSSVIIEDFYAAMRAVRDRHDVKWSDDSKIKTEYSWENIKMRYTSKMPLWKIKLPINEVHDTYDSEKIYTHCDVRVKVSFTLEIPTPPENERNGSNCHIVEEVVTETTTKKVKTMKCM